MDRMPKPGNVSSIRFMAERARQLDEELEASGCLLGQPSQHRRRRQPIKGEIQLDQRKVLTVISEHLPRSDVRRIKTSHPIWVRITGSADPDLHRGPWSVVRSSLYEGGGRRKRAAGGRKRGQVSRGGQNHGLCHPLPSYQSLVASCGLVTTAPSCWAAQIMTRRVTSAACRLCKGGKGWPSGKPRSMPRRRCTTSAVAKAISRCD